MNRRASLEGTTLLVVGAIVFLAVAGPARSQPAAKPAKEAVKLVTKVYDVRDLVNIWPNYKYEVSWAERPPKPEPAVTGSGFFDGEEGAREPAPRVSSADYGTEQALATIRAMIEDAVDTKDWTTRPTAIRTLGTLIVVRQTERSHQEISAALSALRKAVQACRTVAVRARWVLLDPSQLEVLLGGAGKKLVAPHVLTEQALQAAKAAVVARGMACGMDGQRVFVVSGSEQAYVANVEPVVSEGAAALRPIVAHTLSGIVLEVKPVLAADSEHASLTIHGTLGDVKGSRLVPLQQAVVGAYSQPVPGTGGKDESPKYVKAPGAKPPPAVGQLECPNFVMQTLRTTVTVPLDKLVLVGGMTAPAEARGDRDGKVMYLIVQVSASKGGAK